MVAFEESFKSLFKDCIDEDSLEYCIGIFEADIGILESVDSIFETLGFPRYNGNSEEMPTNLPHGVIAHPHARYMMGRNSRS